MHPWITGINQQLQKHLLIQVKSWHSLWEHVLQLQPSVLKADLASVNVLQHTDENFDMTCDRDYVKSLEAHSPFSPQTSGSHPSLFLNTGHHQSDSQDH